MGVPTLDDLLARGVSGQRVFVRADLNVPLDERREVADDTRIRATLPTLRALLDAGARVVLMSHLGRPKGRPDPEFSLRPVAERLSSLLARPVEFSEETAGEGVKARVEALANGELLLLENTRFHPGDEKNDPALSSALAELAELVGAPAHHVARDQQ